VIRMRLAVAFKHRETGERRIITVDLTHEQVLDVMYQAARRGLAGWPPLEARYAIDRAGLAPEFEPVTKGGIRRIEPLQVITNTAQSPQAE
jgi:hypothetical protein